MSTSLPDLSQTGLTRTLLSTPARRRMMILALTAGLMSFACGGFDFLCPLWVVRGLGYDESQWAQMRSLRFSGVLIGVIILGALSDRLGQRRIAAICLIGMAALVGVLGCGWQQGIWVVMPVYGACASTVFVNMNSLIQGVSAQRQGLANTIYRSVGAAAVILAPMAVTWSASAWHGYSPVLLVLAVILVISSFVLLLHPNDVSPSPLGPLRQEIRQLWSGYRVALRQRGLIGYIHVSQIWGSVLIGVGAFATLRFTGELGQTEQQVGVVGTVAGLVALCVTAGSGFFLDRMPLRTLHIIIGIAAGIASILMGIGDYLWLSVCAYVVFVSLTTMQTAPMSMWISRAAGESSQTSAFTVHKVVTAFYVTLAMVLLGVLESKIGMRLIFLYGGILGVIAAICYFLLPEPPHPRMMQGSNTRDA